MDKPSNKPKAMTYDEVYAVLHAVYGKYRPRYRGNPDSKQMCCMWSTDDPPDTITESDQWAEIEEKLDMSFEEDEAFDLYDMDLDEAAEAIVERMNLSKETLEGLKMGLADAAAGRVETLDLDTL